MMWLVSAGGSSVGVVAADGEGVGVGRDLPLSALLSDSGHLLHYVTYCTHPYTAGYL